MSAPETIDRSVAIARGDALEGQNWAQLSPKDRDTAELGLRRVLAAGYRILGPDEVDPVTLERAAKECDRIDNECGMEAGLAASCAATIRALASGESR